MVHNSSQVMPPPIRNRIIPIMGPAGGSSCITPRPIVIKPILNGNMRIQAHMGAGTIYQN